MHYGPQYHSHLVQMNRKGLVPDFYERKQLFVEALERLSASDYVRTGFEHFAKPRDPVAAAVAKGQAYYNSFGATTGQGEWGLFQDFLKNPKDIAGIQKKLESAATAAYKKGK
jgi:hypothetical protein